MMLKMQLLVSRGDEDFSYLMNQFLSANRVQHIQDVKFRVDNGNVYVLLIYRT